MKRFLRGISSLAFKISLVLLVVLGSVILVFSTPGQLKESLKVSKVYDNLVASIIDSATKESAGQLDGSIEESAFSQPAVQEAAKKALTPVFLQTTSEEIINGIYGWLRGDTPQPEFNIDVSAVRQRFITSVGDYAVNRAKTLPACTAEQSAQLTQQSIDALTTACVPAGYNVENLRAQIETELNKQETEAGQQKDNLLQQTTISPDTLPKDENGKTAVQNFAENAEKAPEVFSFVVITPWIFGILAIISAGLVVLLYDDKRRGIRSLGISALAIGGLSLLGIFISNFGFKQLEKSDSLLKADANIKEPLLAFLHSLSRAFNNRILTIGLVYVVLGAGTLLVLQFTKTKQPKEQAPATDEENPENSDKDTEIIAKQKEQEPTKPNNTLVQ